MTMTHPARGLPPFSNRTAPDAKKPILKYDSPEKLACRLIVSAAWLGEITAPLKIYLYIFYLEFIQYTVI